MKRYSIGQYESGMQLDPDSFGYCLKNSCGFWAEEVEECAIALIPTAIRLIDDVRVGIASLWERGEG